VESNPCPIACFRLTLGSESLSEPEVRNERFVQSTFSNIKFVNNIHSSGGLFMWPPSAYTPARVPLPQPLQARARNAANTATTFGNVGSSASPLGLLTWSAPISNDSVTLDSANWSMPTTRSARARTARR
jgi:hypothetical protein